MNIRLCLFCIFISKVIRKASIFFKSDFLSGLATSICVFATYKSQSSFDFSRYNTKSNEGVIPNNIFVYWGQGFDNAPKVVKRCKHEIEVNFKDEFKIHFITDENINDYVTFPDFIYKYLNSGVMSKTHFSDILRFTLLKKYGGYWIDSTVFTTPKTKSVMKSSSSFFTLRHSNYPRFRSYNEGLWTVYFIGTTKSSPLSSFVSDYLINYWKENSKPLDYFHLDYAITLARRKVEAINDILFSQVECYGEKRWLIADVCNKSISDDIDLLISTDPVQVYKLSYKVNAPESKSTYYYKYYV